MTPSLLALSLSFAPALPQDDERRLRPARAAVPEAPVVLEMKMRGPMPAVEVQVNGQGPFLFAIDTGGQGAARADVSLLAKLGLEATAEVLGSDGSGRGGTRMKVVELESIEVSGARFEGVRALSRDYNSAASHLPRIDGILGYHLFSGHVLTLDYPGRKVTVQRGPYAFPEGARPVTITSEPDDLPRVSASIGGHVLEGAALDTGKMGGLGLPSALADDLEFLEPLRVIGRGRTVSGEFEFKRGRVKGVFALGSLRVTDPEIDMAEPFPFAIIGSTFLAPYVATFDPGQAKLWIRTPEEDRRLREAERDEDDGR